MKAIINVRIYDYVNYYECGYVIFDEYIHEVGSMANFKKGNYIEIIDGQGKLLLPNFVCAHSHIYSIFARGLAFNASPTSFEEILSQIWWKLDASLTNEITYYSAIAAGYEFLLNGITTVIDHHASGEILGSLNSLSSALSNIGIRGLYCFETSDRYNIDKCLQENVDFIKKGSGDVKGLFGMHASLTLSDDSLSKISKINNNYPIHIHVDEDIIDEIDAKEKYQKSVIKRLDDFHLINENSLLVHGVYLTSDELDIIEQRKAYLVVNTTSNMNNGVGLPNVKNYLKHNIKVMVGNDGLSSNMANEYLNVLYTSHLKNKSYQELNLDDVKQMILNSYEYVSKMLNCHIGQIAKDYVADFMMVSYCPFTKIDVNNAFGHIFYGLFPAFKPSDVFSHGIAAVKDYKVNNKFLIEQYSKCQKYSSMLWQKVKGSN